MNYTATFFSTSVMLAMSFPVYALDVSFSNKKAHVRRASIKESFENLPLAIRTSFLNNIKDEKKLTTSEAFAEGIDALSAKKYRSWTKKNKQFLPSVIDAFYRTHFESTSRKCKRKVTDAIDILYSIDEETKKQYAPLAGKLKSFLAHEGKAEFEKQFLTMIKKAHRYSKERGTKEQQEMYYPYLQFLVSLNPHVLQARDTFSKKYKEKGYTALHYAVRLYDADLVDFICKQSSRNIASVNVLEQQDARGKTPFAVAFGRLKYKSEKDLSSPEATHSLATISAVLQMNGAHVTRSPQRRRETV